MIIVRSTKCSLKYTTEEKKETLRIVLEEYGRVCNIFIGYFWNNGVVSKSELLKEIVNIPDTWLSARLRKVCAREALDMCNSVINVFEWNKEQIEINIKDMQRIIAKTKPDIKKNRRKINSLYVKIEKAENKLSMIQMHKPVHQGKRMTVSCTIGELQESNNSYDSWLHLQSIGNKIILDLPIKFHRHFHQLGKEGKRLNAYIITDKYVQFSFEINTGSKKEVRKIRGIDTGINALASTSDRKQYGTDIKECIERVKRCEKGSKGQKRAIRALKQRIDEVAKETVQDTDMIVKEGLYQMNNNSKLKGSLSQNMRSSIGSWNYSYWLMRLEQNCERNRVSFRSVPSYYTSQKCPICSHTDSRNRSGDIFICQSCGHSDNADINAAINIKERFLTGKYGSCYKTEELSCL